MFEGWALLEADMRSLFGLSRQQLAEIPWSEFQTNMRYLMWREDSGWRLWVIGRMDKHKKSAPKKSVSPDTLRAALGLTKAVNA